MFAVFILTAVKIPLTIVIGYILRMPVASGVAVKKQQSGSVLSIDSSGANVLKLISAGWLQS